MVGERAERLGKGCWESQGTSATRKRSTCETLMVYTRGMHRVCTMTVPRPRTRAGRWLRSRHDSEHRVTMKEIPAGLSRRYRRRLGVYTCLLGVVVGLVITEVVLQAIGAVQEFRTYSATRGWRLRPGAAGWNSREGQAYVTINA